MLATTTATATTRRTELRILTECRSIMQIIFKITKNHPEYRYNVNDQLIRSGLSIGSNISEGNQRRGKDRNHFFNIALGSLEECRFQLSMFNDEINKEEVDDILDKIRATTINLSKSQSHSSS